MGTRQRKSQNVQDEILIEKSRPGTFSESLITLEKIVKKILIWTTFLALLVGPWTGAGAFGKRAKGPAQLPYHLATQGALLESCTAVSFVGDRPAMVATDESVQFLRASGETAIRVERTGHTQVFLSKGGNFVGIQELSDPGEESGGPRSLIFTLFDKEGEKLWSHRQSLGGDEPVPSFYLSDLGGVVVVKPLESMFTFLDERGSPHREFRLFAEAATEMERPIACSFSTDGNRLVVNALRQYARPGTELSPRMAGQSFLALFDARGQELWRRELEGEISDRVDISPNGQMIAAGAYSVRGLDSVERATYLYNGEGKLLHSLDFSFRHAAFSSDGQFLLLAQKSSLHLVETRTGRVLWRKSLPQEAGQVRALDLSPQGNLTLAMAAVGSYQGFQFVYHSPRIFLFDDQGRQVWQEDFVQDTFLQPLARFQEDGSGVLLAFQKRYLIYAQEK